MATTKKPAAPAVAKEAPAVAAKPVAKAATAKPAVPKAAAPVAKKAAAKAPAVAKPVAVKAAAPAAKAKAPARKKPAVIDPGQRANSIEVAAFYIAERRGFAPGKTEQDYLDAAAEIDRLIAAGHFGK